MATITGLTAARMLAIEAASVVDGEVVGDDLILTRHDASTINAGDVRGPQGIQGVPGSDLVVASATGILEVGVLNQIRAGRLLTAADFTNMGLSAPAALYPLSGTPDTSGNGRTLTNKGTVPFTAKGIAGAANTAALFAGNVAQALYFLDTGGSDPFRINTGSFGCWFRTAKTGVNQALMGKYNSSDGNHAWWMQVLNTNNSIQVASTATGLAANNVSCDGTTVVADDKWHFAVGVIDGATLKLYIDGHLEKNVEFNGYAFGGSAPFNIGGLTANAGTNALNPFFGKIDEAFVTHDVLSEEQIRNLYCARILHSLGGIPKRAALNIRRRRKGGAFVSGDFPTQPVRLYNFTAGALTDAGSNGTSVVISGTPNNVAGVDGAAGNAKRLDGISAQMMSTDTGLPSGTNARSYGLWLKQEVTSGSQAVMGWGNGAGTSSQALYINPSGQIVARSTSDDIAGPFIGDRKWHFVVVTEENAPVDGNKRKLYVDGELVGASGTLVSITLGGANKFRIGIWPDGTGTFLNGYVDGVFICNYVLDAPDILALYAKGSLALAQSPKNPGDHIEAMSATELLVDFSSLESQHQIDLAVA